MEKSGFFNSVNGDRKYKADFFALYFSSFIGNGIFPNPATNLEVVSNNNMTIAIKKGMAWINGYIYINTDDLILPINVADGVLNRIDRVTLRYDTLSRDIKAVIKKGEYATNAVPKQLQRDADAYELALSDIKINAGAISINQSDITDLRLNKELCGIVHGTVEQVDTTEIFRQFQDWYSKKKSEYDKDIATWTDNKKKTFDKWYADNTIAFMKQFNNWYGSNTNKWTIEFTEWFKKIKGQLDEDIAGKLLNRINYMIVLSDQEPTTDNTDIWLHDVGENFEISGGDGVVIANAGFNDNKDIKFEELK